MGKNIKRAVVPRRTIPNAWPKIRPGKPLTSKPSPGMKKVHVAGGANDVRKANAW